MKQLGRPLLFGKLKKFSWSSELSNDAFEPTNHKTHFNFYSSMSVECTNQNLKTAQTAQLEQPAPKLELDLYIQTWQSKIKNTFVIRRQKGINCELRGKKSVARHLIMKKKLLKMFIKENCLGRPIFYNIFVMCCAPFSSPKSGQSTDSFQEMLHWRWNR